MPPRRGGALGGGFAPTLLLVRLSPLAHPTGIAPILFWFGSSHTTGRLCPYSCRGDGGNRLRGHCRQQEGSRAAHHRSLKLSYAPRAALGSSHAGLAAPGLPRRRTCTTNGPRDDDCCGNTGSMPPHSHPTDGEANEQCAVFRGRSRKVRRAWGACECGHMQSFRRGKKS